MAPTSTTSPPSLPSSESLLLSASLFTSSVSSWIPANFGHVVPPAEAEKEWQTLLRSAGEGKDRLGLGHPLINAPKAAGGGYRGGLQGLEKSIKNGKRRVGDEERERGDKPDDGSQRKEADEDEEDSRASMVGKRKRAAVFDPLGGKKKKAQKGAGTPAQTPTASAGNSARAGPTLPVAAPPSSQAVGTDTAQTAETVTPPKSPSKSLLDTVPPSPAHLAHTPKSSSKPSHEASSSSHPTQTTSAPASPAKSKSALKREKKRLAKQAKLALEAQS